MQADQTIAFQEPGVATPPQLHRQRLRARSHGRAARRRRKSPTTCSTAAAAASWREASAPAANTPAGPSACPIRSGPASGSRRLISSTKRSAPPAQPPSPSSTKASGTATCSTRAPAAPSPASLRATAIASSAAEADALSTAFYVMGPRACRPILRRAARRRRDPGLSRRFDGRTETHHVWPRRSAPPPSCQFLAESPRIWAFRRLPVVSCHFAGGRNARAADTMSTTRRKTICRLIVPPTD